MLLVAQVAVHVLCTELLQLEQVIIAAGATSCTASCPGQTSVDSSVARVNHHTSTLFPITHYGTPQRDGWSSNVHHSIVTTKNHPLITTTSPQHPQTRGNSELFDFSCHPSFFSPHHQLHAIHHQHIIALHSYNNPRIRSHVPQIAFHVNLGRY